MQKVFFLQKKIKEKNIFIYIYYLQLKSQLTLTGTGSDGISDEKKADIKDAVVDTIDVKFLCSAC